MAGNMTASKMTPVARFTRRPGSGVTGGHPGADPGARSGARGPLPTESELTAALGVGRNTLRESLKALQAVGVIEIRHGFGMFVAASNFEALTDGLTFRARMSLRHHGEEAMQLVSSNPVSWRRHRAPGTAGRGRGMCAADRGSSAAGEPFIEADAEFTAGSLNP